MQSAERTAIPADMLRDGYRTGRLTPAEVVDMIVGRVAARGADHVWITLVPPAELARRAAALTGHEDLPLYGIPFAVKDNIDVAGLPTTAACPDFAYVPTETAPVVRRLVDAGAILVGKTNLDQFATGLTGVRSPYGACESVYGGGLVSGGSSSGSAVAVAAGLVSFALGTDTAGSGRVPAALNGIVGLKPTLGLLSTVGVVPACRSLDCVSVFAPTVSGAVEVARLAAGPAGPWDRPAEPGDPVPADRIRLGVPAAQDLDFAGDTAMAAAYDAAARAAAGHAGRTVGVDLGPFLAAGDLLYEGPWVAERLSDLSGFLERHPEAVLPVTRRIIEGGRRFDAADTFRAMHRLRELRAAADRVWREVDAIVVPTVPTTYTIADVEREPLRHNATLGRYTHFANLLDLAVVSVPAGHTADGRPAGISLVGPARSDATLAGLAAAVTGEPPGYGATAPSAGAAGAPTTTLIAVVGRHLRGESRHHELVRIGAEFAGDARTADAYRLYLLPGGLPGMARVSRDGAGIDVELWRVPAAAVGGFLAGVPAPLGIGWVRLADGREVLGFLCEAYAVGPDTPDLTGYGGWRAYRRSGVDGGAPSRP